MQKFVSWIDSLPRLASNKRKNGNNGEQQSKKRFEKVKSTASTPLIKDKNEDKKKSKRSSTQEKSTTLESRSIASTIRAIGRRRYTEPDAFQRLGPLGTLSPSSVLSPRLFVTSPMEDEMDEDVQFMSVSWHPDGIDRVRSLKIDNCCYDQKLMSRSLISSQPVSCSVQEMTMGDDDRGSSATLQSQMTTTRPQIRTNPWIRPKSPRVIPALDLSHTTSSLSVRKSHRDQIEKSISPKSGSQLLEPDSGKKHQNDGSSVYSLRSSSGYGSGGSQDSSPASSVHTPDWQNLSVSRYGSAGKSSSNFRIALHRRDSNGAELKLREDVALQCDLTMDKSVECTEEDFPPFLGRDENGNIPMIDDEYASGESDCYDEDAHLCNEDCRGVRSNSVEKLARNSNLEVNDNLENPESTNLTSHLESALTADDGQHSEVSDSSSSSKSSAVLNLLHAKVELLKANSDQVAQAIRSAKEEQRKRNGELRVYEEQMQFLKQLKLAISNGFEVMV